MCVNGSVWYCLVRGVSAVRLDVFFDASEGSGHDSIRIVKGHITVRVWPVFMHAP